MIPPSTATAAAAATSFLLEGLRGGREESHGVLAHVAGVSHHLGFLHHGLRSCRWVYDLRRQGGRGRKGGREWVRPGGQRFSKRELAEETYP